MSAETQPDTGQMLYCWRCNFHPVQSLLGGLGCEQLGKTLCGQEKLVTVPGHFSLPGSFATGTSCQLLTLI